MKYKEKIYDSINSLDDLIKVEELYYKRRFRIISLIAVSIIIIATLGILLYKNINSLLTVHVDSATLLSILLALFSIGISIAFYFNAEKTSNRFYDNTYKYMKDQSDLLSEVKAGFSAQLSEILSNIKDSAYKASANSLKELKSLEGYVKESETVDKVDYIKRINEARSRINSNLINVVSTADTGVSIFSEPIGNSISSNPIYSGFISQIPSQAIDLINNRIRKDKISSLRFNEGVRKGFFNKDGTITNKGRRLLTRFSLSDYLES